MAPDAISPRYPSTTAVDGPRAWLLAAGAFGANFTTFGFLFSFGLFLTPMADSFGTRTGPVAGVFSAMVFSYYLSGALGGVLARRVGVRPVVAVGGALFCTSLILASRLDRLGLLYPALALPVGVGIGGCYAPMVGAVGSWFERRRTQAIAAVLTGVGAGTMLMPLVTRALIDAVGWRQAMATIGWASAAVFAVAALVSTPAPGDTQAPPLALSLATRAPLFRRLYASVFLISPAFYAPLAFINDYAVDRGVAAGPAAALVGVIGGTSVVARLFFGAVGDRLGAHRQYRLSYLFMTGGVALWLGSGADYRSMLGAAALHGIGWAAWVTATPGVLARAFGPRALGAVLGLFYTSLGFGGLVGPWLTGALIDRNGFRAGIVFALGCAAAATAVVATTPGRPADDEVRSAAPAPR